MYENYINTRKLTLKSRVSTCGTFVVRSRCVNYVDPVFPIRYLMTNKKQGNECVDVKEGAMDTRIETNYCTGQLDEDSAGIDSRASGSVIRYNKVVGCKGAGVRLGGHKIGNDQYGVDCQVYCNILENNENGGIKIMTEPHQICQNTISGDGDNVSVVSCLAVVLPCLWS